MKDRLVFWGKRNEDERVLLTIDLNEDEGTYQVQIMKAEKVTEEFDNLVRNHWRNGSDDVVFPEIEESFTKELTLTADLLPDNYEVERDDLIKMAQAEWNFYVLSKRLKDTYIQELEELQEEADGLEDFSDVLWDKMKVFWNKVQGQIRENNLARRHGNDIRRKTNAIFSILKDFRTKSEKALVEESAVAKVHFINRLDEIERKIEGGKSLRHLFDELKRVQKEFKKVRFTQEDHSQVWEKLDGLFKDIKEKKYGKKASGNDPLMKVLRRIEGLTAAMNRMEKSIKRDKNDLKYQNKRIDDADGQLEAQIRKAKLSMLEERISSKQAKYDDMEKTLAQLKKRAEKLEKKAEEEKIEAERKKIEAEVRQRISTEIKEKNEEISQDPQVRKAAEMVNEPADKTTGAVISEKEATGAAAIISAAVWSAGEQELEEE